MDIIKIVDGVRHYVRLPITYSIAGKQLKMLPMNLKRIRLLFSEFSDFFETHDEEVKEDKPEAIEKKSEEAEEPKPMEVKSEEKDEPEEKESFTKTFEKNIASPLQKLLRCLFQETKEGLPNDFIEEHLSDPPLLVDIWDNFIDQNRVDWAVKKLSPFLTALGLEALSQPLIMLIEKASALKKVMTK